ncbi:MAG TPA: hypothetical protein VGF99_17435 [Myxococcota bacterium]
MLRALLFVVVVLVAGSATAQQAECRTGGDGVAVCGYACRVGGNGRVACAQTPQGVCSVGGNGIATCFDPQRPRGRFSDDDEAPRTPATCRTGGDGGVACGWDCRVGGDGISVCADTDDGVCRVGGNGRATCTSLSHLPRALRSQGTAECRVGGNGAVACGYACRVGGNGVAVCAQDPRGTCAVGGNGQVGCFNPPGRWR